MICKYIPVLSLVYAVLTGLAHILSQEWDNAPSIIGLGNLSDLLDDEFAVRRGLLVLKIKNEICLACLLPELFGHPDNELG